MFSYFLNSITDLLVDIPVILIILIVFENAKGWMTLNLGDKTPLEYEQIGLNPIKYIDIFGFLFFTLFSFGWSRTITIDSRRLKHRLDIALISFAGFAANILMIILLIVLLKIYMPSPETFFYKFFLTGIQLNLNFLILNFIPFPPLECSRIIEIIYPDYYKFEPIGIILLLFLFITKFGQVLQNLSFNILDILV